MYILGINAYHGDASACIYQNGRLIVATEEERFRRVKHWAGLPVQAIHFCLQEAQIALPEVNVICVSRDPKAKLSRKIIYTLLKRPSLATLKSRARNSFNIQGLKKEIAEALAYQETEIKANVQYIEHHRSHLASAFFTSPFKEAALLSIDGMGDFSSTMSAVGKGSKITVKDSVSYPHSLGYFYTAFTQYLGFPNYGDEYKVMGLSAYGQPTLIDRLRKIVQTKKDGKFILNPAYFSHFKKGVQMTWNEGAPFVAPMYSQKLVGEFGPVRQKGEPLTDFHKDLAASVQKRTEEVIFQLAENLYRQTKLRSLCLSGGCAQNSVANGKIIENTSFEKLFIPPAGHDGGTALGSALYHFHHNLGNPRTSFRIRPYTGARFSNEQIKSMLDRANLQYAFFHNGKLLDVVTDCLIEGGIVGWFQGRAELGPRALGNRSIIVDPRRKDARDLLNLKIKKRENFRPFAPSVLKERAGEYFERADETPFMEKVFKIKREKRSIIPAVTHADGTGRLQTVDRQNAPRYYQLISKFAQKTGVPVLLNTSFNENEPIVNSPQEALNCFLRTQMDMLVMENFVVTRQ